MGTRIVQVLELLAVSLILVFYSGMVSLSAEKAPLQVDLELVLAVDVSGSMDFEEQETQRQGYVEAFRAPEVIKAILNGYFARINVTYMEWSGATNQRVVVPWRIIDSVQSAHEFSQLLAEDIPGRYNRTSISSAFAASLVMFDHTGTNAFRRVIDISGDGPNNQGLPVDLTRDRVLDNGIVINGLPLMLTHGKYGFGVRDLRQYFADCVIGGPGSFLIPVRDWGEFPHALRRKLVLEIGGLTPHDAPLQAQRTGIIHKVAASVTDCQIGEKNIEKFLPKFDYNGQY